MIKTKYDGEIREELQRKIMYAAFEMASKDEVYDIISCGIEGKPELKLDAEFKFTLGADVAPEIEVGDYKAIQSAKFRRTPLPTSRSRSV